MIRCEKQVRIGHRKGLRGYVSVTREHYLRDDISCKVETCILCNVEDSPVQGAKLSPHLSHYVIPDTSVLCDYLEVVEHHSIQGMILLQTPLSHIHSKKRRLHSKLVALLKRSEKQCVMFSNENHVETFVSRHTNEITREWHTRLILKAGIWYANHIQVAGRSTSIVIVTTEGEYKNFPRPPPGENVTVVTLTDYLTTHVQARSELLQLYESLRENAEPSTNVKEKTKFWSYLSEELISVGLKKGLIVSGTLHVSRQHPRDNACVRVKMEDKSQSSNSGTGEILIYGNISRNRGIHGDMVAVQLLPKELWRTRSGQLAGSADSNSTVMTTGVVVGIISRKDREYVASFDEISESSGSSRSMKVLVYPYDVRVPKVRISTRQAEALRRHRIVIRIDSWEVDSQYPNGHFVRSIGPTGNLETETNVILIEHGLSSQPFSKALLSELPSTSAETPWSVEEGNGRRDLRTSHLVFSIDPQGCEDVDDTLSVRKLQNGRTELGVHIADVTHFVRPGSLTDEEARHRSTTVYLADRRYDMLPAVLSADLCSLLSNVDRHAVSVVWELDNQYRVQKVWYGRTIIRSKYKLAYETAQALFDGASTESVLKDIPELQDPSLSSSELERRVRELRSAISDLVTISRVLRDRRSTEGALELESVEVKVQMSNKDSTNIEDLLPKQPLEMHEVIAECMIFANHWVAKKIHEAYPTQALLRHHPPPSQDNLASLAEFARVRGFTLSTESNKALAESLNNCVDPQDPTVNTILRNLATQVMNQAAYFSTGSLPNKEYFHYGLALDLYTHFTSPIRRYADIIVHRQLLSALENPTEEVTLLPGNSRLTEMAQHMNERHRAAQMAQLASTELFQCLYFSSLRSGGDGDVGGEARDRVEGMVVGIRSNGISVLVPRYGIRSIVYLKDKNGLVLQPSGSQSDEGVVFGTGSIEVTSNNVIVTHSNGSFTLTLFDHLLLRVCVETSHAHGYSISLKLLQCGPVKPLSASSGESKDGNKTLVQTVRSEAESEATVRYSQDLTISADEYRQSSSDHSLYCVLQHFQRLSLMEI